MTNQTKVHWMISVLLVVGAWLTVLFLFGWTFLLHGSDARHLLYLGGFFIAAAAVLAWRVRRADSLSAVTVFLSQLELALSLSGKALFCIALMLRLRLGPGGEFVVLALMAVCSYPVFRQPADRAVTVCAALCMGVAWPVLVTSFPGILLETVCVVLFMGSYVLWVREKEAEKSLAWALLGACLFASSIWLSETSDSHLFGLAQTAQSWAVANSLLLGAALSIIYVRCNQEQANGWIVQGILLLCLLSNLGAVMGGALLALGFAQKRLALKVIGVLGMYASLIWLYYNIQNTLLVKAGYLVAAGIILLGAYTWLTRGNKYAR